MLCEIDLIDVTSGNPFADAFDALQEMRAGHLRFEIADVAGRCGGGGLHAVGHVTDFRPVIGLVVINEHVRVVSEDKRAVIIDRSAESTMGEAGIEGGALVFAPSSAEQFLVYGVVDVSVEEKLGLSCDERNGWSGIAGRMAGGIEKQESFLLGEMLCHFPRREISPRIGTGMNLVWHAL